MPMSDSPSFPLTQSTGNFVSRMISWPGLFSFLRAEGNRRSIPSRALVARFVESFRSKRRNATEVSTMRKTSCPIAKEVNAVETSRIERSLGLSAERPGLRRALLVVGHPTSSTNQRHCDTCFPTSHLFHRQSSCSHLQHINPAIIVGPILSSINYGEDTRADLLCPESGRHASVPKASRASETARLQDGCFQFTYDSLRYNLTLELSLGI